MVEVGIQLQREHREHRNKPAFDPSCGTQLPVIVRHSGRRLQLDRDCLRIGLYEHHALRRVGGSLPAGKPELVGAMWSSGPSVMRVPDSDRDGMRQSIGSPPLWEAWRQGCGDDPCAWPAWNASDRRHRFVDVRTSMGTKPPLGLASSDAGPDTCRTGIGKRMHPAEPDWASDAKRGRSIPLTFTDTNLLTADE